MTMELKIDYEPRTNYTLGKITGLIKGESREASKALTIHISYEELKREINKIFQENRCKCIFYSLTISEQAVDELGSDKVGLLESLVRVQNFIF